MEVIIEKIKEVKSLSSVLLQFGLGRIFLTKANFTNTRQRKTNLQAEVAAVSKDSSTDKGK